LKKELEFSEKSAIESPKNYQIWYHRRWLVEKLNDPSKEFDLTCQMFEDDSKNYHAWAHRQWCLEKYNLWDGELDYTNYLLKNDPRNNSAWNHRYWVITNWEKWNSEIKKREIQFVADFIKLAPNNQSSWNYLKGVVGDNDTKEFPEVERLCRFSLDNWPTCPHGASLLVDILEQRADSQSFLEAIQICEKLAKSLDNIHSKYWFYRASCFNIGNDN